MTVLDPPDPGMRAHVGYLRAHQFTQWGGSAGWPNYELPFVRWAERNGYDLDYAVNADLEDPATLADRRVYLSVGHDEYWSGPMRDTVEAFTAPAATRCSSRATPRSGRYGSPTTAPG